MTNSNTGSPTPSHPDSAPCGPSAPPPENPPPAAGPDPQPSTTNPQPSFPRLPGETPRAFSAFLAFFQLGQARSLPAVADKLGENPGTVRNWSARFEWSQRIQDFNSGLLQQAAQAQARQAADWAERLQRLREQEWDTAQKLLLAAQCFLESFDEADLRKMTLAQVARALTISSRLGRSALAGAQGPAPAQPELSPVQQQLLESLKRVYGQPAPAPDPGTDKPAIHPNA